MFRYLLEFVAFYALAFVVEHFIDPAKAAFQAGLATFFLTCACLISRPSAPHQLFWLMTRPAILLVSVIVVGFGALGGREPDLSVLAPGVGLCLIGAAFADRVERARRNK
ncbi:hypothetical protein VSR68_09740 [Paraburkholderia phymatum]|uniref:hypothetical protein n=1 Tax=Paraburkholderia phymatum TaxID=148447 RepID=UPI0031726E75